MVGKILVIVFAFVAGAGGAYAYQFASENLALFQQEKEEDPRIAELESRLAAMTQRVQELGAEQQEAGSEAEVLAARLNSFEEQLSGLQEKLPRLAAANGSAQKAAQNAASVGEDTAGQPSAAVPVKRISGEELVEALKELPEEGKQMIRQAIHQEVQRIKKENEPKLPTKEELERKVAEGIQKLTVALALTPIQVEQAREIAARHIDRLLEVARAAKERDDPGYAEAAKKEIQAQLEQEVVEALTPEQVDKLREMDPDGFGRRHPRGF